MTTLKPTETLESYVPPSLESTMQDIKDELSRSVTVEGLVPELNESARFEKFEGVEGVGFTSELLGYGMRLAVENDDRELFERLHAGYKFLLGKGNNGLLRARLHVDLSVDESEATSWADGNQDVALSLIEAGQKWGGVYESEGVALAEAFINNGHVNEVSGNTLIFSSAADEQGKFLGERVRMVDLSQWNFRLYEKMSELRPDDSRWEAVYQTGIDLMSQTLDHFRLPPNRVPIVDGSVCTHTAFLERLSNDAELAETIKMPIEVLRESLADPFSEYRLYGWDAIRNPYRFSDVADPKLLEMAVTIYQRLNNEGVLGVRIQSETGSTEKSDVLSPSVAPCLTARISADGDVSSALAVLDATLQAEKSREDLGVFKTPLYWKMWDGLALSQVRRYFQEG